MFAHLDDRELATVLAALRYWQRDLVVNDCGPISPDYFDATITPLSDDDIDNLCERLNGGVEVRCVTDSHYPQIQEDPPNVAYRDRSNEDS